MKQFFNRNKILIGSLVFLIVYSLALVSFATPPTSPYSAGETLDPSCVPGSSNCTVSTLSIGQTIGNSPIDGSILFIGTSGVVAQDSYFNYDDSTVKLTVGNINLFAESATVGIVNFLTERLHSYGTSNEFWGASAGNFTLTGSNNIGLGTNSGLALTSGSGNVCIGQQTCQVLTTGGNNIFIGKKTGESHSSGDRNILIGYDLDSPSGTTASDTLNIGNIIFGDLASGYIGINDSTPSFALDVTGTISASTQYDIAGEFFAKQDTTDNNIYIGKLAGSSNIATSGLQNIFIGINAGQSNTSGDANVFTGWHAGTANTIGSSNTFYGYYAGDANISGISNTFMGAISGGSTTGSGNTFLGYGAGSTNTSGGYAVAIGTNAQVGTTSGSSISIGYYAGASQIAGAANNLLIGTNAGTAITTSVSNTIIGNNAGISLTNSAGSNVFIGEQSGYSQTTGYENTFIGQIAGRANLSGQRSVAIGNSASYQGTSADRYVAIGYGALASQISAADNVAIGYSAGGQATGGTNVYIGSSGGYLMTSAQYNVMLGYATDLVDRTDSNNFVVGSSYAPIYDTYIGGGDVNASPVAITYHGTGGSGTNIAGGDFVIASGKGTGNASSGSILFQTSDAGASGTTLQSLSTKATLLANGNFGIGVSPTARLQVKGPDTSSTSAFLVTNSTPTTLFEIKDDGTFALGSGANPNASATNTVVGTGATATGAYGVAIGNGASAATNSVNISPYGSSSSGGISTAIGILTNATTWGAWMIGGQYNRSATNDINGSLKFASTSSASQDNYQSLFVAPGANQVFDINTDIRASNYTSHYDYFTENTLTLANGKKLASFSVTSVSNESGNAAFNGTITSGISLGEEVVLSGFGVYTNGTYYVRDVSGSRVTLSSSRMGALGNTGMVAYSSNDTGTITPSQRVPGVNITDASQWYSADIASGESSPFFRTENGAVIGLGSSKFGLMSNNDLNLTANSTVGATLKASNNFFGIGSTSPAYKLTISDQSTTTVQQRFYNSATGTTSTDGFDFGITSANATFWNFENGYIGFATNNSERFRIESGGTAYFASSLNIGSANTPTTTLDVRGANVNAEVYNTTDGGNTDFYFSGDTGGGTSKYFIQRMVANDATNGAMYFLPNSTTTSNSVFTIQSDGSIGVGDSTPDYLFDIEKTSVDTDIFALTDSDGACLHNPESGSETVTCSSDERLKTNITDADSMLSYLGGLTIRQYDVIASGDHLTGVIAQEVQLIHPELVTIGPNGYFSVASPNTWQLIKAIQELDVKISPLADLLTEDNSVADAIRTFLANSTNKITRIFTGEICLSEEGYDSECINREELHSLKQLIQNQGGTSGTTSGDGTSGGDTGGTGDVPQDTTPPTITLIGDPSITLSVGDTYTEQGATATDDTDGDITGNIQITNNLDTNTPGTYTVRYTVVDSSGNQAEVTREVVVG